MYCVYVLNRQSKPLMPTTRFGHVRKLLNSGKAVVVPSDVGFTIRLKYDTLDIVQPLYIGIDPGRTNVGVAVVNEDGKPVLMAQVETRNKEIPKLMKARKAYRQHHRKNKRRDARRRRARSAGTVKAPSFERKLPQCDKPITCHDIKNKEARFCNRRRMTGWLTPTARQLLLTHVNIIKKLMKILPISNVVLELNRFDFQAMDNPNIQKWQYQRGQLYGKGSVEQAVYDMQEERCILCGGRIQHYHHVVPQHLNGSNTCQNIVGLCEQCHAAVHTNDEAKSKLANLKEGLNKQHHALSVLNQIIPFLVDELAAMFPIHTFVTDGLSTSLFRKTNGYAKVHHVDAYCIALTAMPQALPAAVIPEPVYVKQFRRHDRQACHKENIKRVYCLNGKPIAVNRHRAFEQKEFSLVDVRGQLTEAEISRLTVKPHKPIYKRMDRLMPGSIYLYYGCRYVLKGTSGLHNGIPQYCISLDGSKHPYRQCIFVKRNAGLVVS